jgi:hypothetical protein
MPPIGAMMPAATVRLTPVIVSSRFHGAVVERPLGDLAIKDGEVFAEPIEFSQMPVDCLAFVVRQPLAREPPPPWPIEQST